MNILGIDPGLKGAFALYNGSVLVLERMPIMKSSARGKDFDWPQLADLFALAFSDSDHAFLEKAAARRLEGVSSAFKNGSGFGGLIALINAHDIPLTIVSPVQWKRGAGVKQAKEAKAASFERALQLFPKYAPYFRGPRGAMLDGVAEAALIAYYGYRKVMMMQPQPS